MLRSALTALVLLLAAEGGLAAQTGELGVSLTILEPLAFSAAPRAPTTVRYRSGEFVEVAMPLEPAGSEGRIVAVSGGAGATGTGNAGLRVRTPDGGFETLTEDRAVALGTSGKVRGADAAEAVYRLDLQGKPAPKDLLLTLRYLIAPDA